MSRNRFLIPSVAVALLGLGLAPRAQTEATPAPTPRVAIIGASLIAGAPLKNFVQNAKPAYRAETVGLGAVMAGLYGSDCVTDLSDLWFFQGAPAKGTAQVKRLDSSKPHLVIGLDFLFWFGYGDGGPGGKRPKSDDVEAWRLDKQIKGFELVDEIRKLCDAPILLGDYPNMSGANPMMLPKSAIPTLATLDKLNERARALPPSGTTCSCTRWPRWSRRCATRARLWLSVRRRPT